MSVKIPISTAIHVVFCTAIALLLAFIVSENAKDYDADIQVLAQKTAQNGQLAIAASNKELLGYFMIEVKCYPNTLFEKYVGFMQVIDLKTDSIQYLIDSLSKKEDLELLSAVKKMLSNQRTLIIQMSDFDETIEAALLDFQPSNLLFQSLESYTDKPYKTILEQAKINSLLVERVALNYFGSRVSVGECDFDIFKPILNWKSISPNVGDTMYADIHLSGYAQDYDDQKFTVNGILAPNYKFKQRFNQLGTYPLQIKVESYDCKHDTVFVDEKTYYITVQK
jgi:hypothetical protein